MSTNTSIWIICTVYSWSRTVRLRSCLQWKKPHQQPLSIIVPENCQTFIPGKSRLPFWYVVTMCPPVSTMLRSDEVKYWLLGSGTIINIMWAILSQWRGGESGMSRIFIIFYFLWSRWPSVILLAHVCSCLCHGQLRCWEKPCEYGYWAIL